MNKALIEIIILDYERVIRECEGMSYLDRMEHISVNYMNNGICYYSYKRYNYDISKDEMVVSYRNDGEYWYKCPFAASEEELIGCLLYRVNILKEMLKKEYGVVREYGGLNWKWEVEDEDGGFNSDMLLILAFVVIIILVAWQR